MHPLHLQLHRAGLAGAKLHVIVPLRRVVIAIVAGRPISAHLDRAISVTLIRQEAQRSTHSHTVGCAQYRIQTLDHRLRLRVVDAVVVMHVEPDVEDVRAPQCQVLDVVFQLFYRRIVIVVVKVRGEVDGRAPAVAAPTCRATRRG